MSAAIIKIAYRQVIDASAKEQFEQMVINLSYNEFLLKSQAYNTEGKFKTFSEMKANDGRANSLHYKCGFAVSGLIETLNKTIPGIKDSLDTVPLFFTSYKFEIVESDITNRLEHKVAITYFTDTLTLHTIIGEYMLLSLGDNTITSSADITETFMIQMRPMLSIIGYGQVHSTHGNLCQPAG